MTILTADNDNTIVETLQHALPDATVQVVPALTPAEAQGQVVAGVTVPYAVAAAAAKVYIVEGENVVPYHVTAVPRPAPYYEYDDGRRPRGYYPRLFVFRDNQVMEFTGESIPGIVAIVKRDYVKDGKWSRSTYTLRFHKAAGFLRAMQEWETGERFHECSTRADLVEVFRNAGCVAPEEAIIACIQTSCPAVLQRIDATAEALRSVEE